VDEITILDRPVGRFTGVVGDRRVAQFSTAMADVRRRLGGHTVWHINSTAEGGGVAEMLQSILGYPRSCGIGVRWMVVDGNDAFFEVTKRIHHLLHGSAGDGGPLGEAERRLYEASLADDADRLAALIEPGDRVMLHDPQTLGLAPRLVAAGAHVVWSCHVGADEPNEQTRTAWRFLAPYARHTGYQVFSRRRYGWELLDPAQVVVIVPCIDAFSAKNQSLGADTVAAVLAAAGVVLPGRSSARPTYRRRDETTGEVASRAEMIEDEPIPPDARIVTQISRWDPLKDHAGVMTGFVQHGPQEPDVRLVLAGPAPESIADDPEGRQTLDELRSAWQRLAAEQRRRVHIACLPMDNLDENAAVVNALQRRSDVVVQKSLAEGFGLTVAEAMWKARPTLGSRVGGIQDQIEHDVSGVLVDPDDLVGFGAALSGLLGDRRAAEALGRAAHNRVCEEFLALRYLERSFELLAGLPDRDDRDDS
jgi:trehalose synthase